jgi:uncharacterized protein YggE
VAFGNLHVRFPVEPADSSIGGAMKTAFPLSALTAVLALAACSGGDEPDAAVAGDPAVADLAALGGPVATGGAPSQGITVTGNGTASAVPDVAEWSFGVRSDAGSADEALRANSRAMERVLAALRSAGLRGKDLRTEQVSVYPRTGPNGRRVDGYSASNTVHAVVRDLGAAGDVVNAAVGAGANEVYGPTLRLADARAQYRAAVDSAYADARARAEAIAAEAGLELGAPVAIVEGAGGGVIPYDARAAAEAGDAALSVPVEPGVQEVTATLSVTFSIG